MLKFHSIMSLEEVKEKVEEFNGAGPELTYIQSNGIDITDYVATFLDVYRDDGFNFNYRSEGREWILLPKEVAQQADYIKITFDGKVIVEKEGEKEALLFSMTKGYDDIVMPKVFFLGNRFDCHLPLSAIAQCLKMGIPDVLTRFSFSHEKIEGMYFLSDEEADKLLNEAEKLGEHA